MKKTVILKTCTMDNQLDAAESRKIALAKVWLLVHEMKEKQKLSTTQ